MPSRAQQHSPPGPHIIIKADPDQQSNSRDEANHTEQTGDSGEKNSGLSDTDHKNEEVILFLFFDDSFKFRWPIVKVHWKILICFEIH